MEIPDYLALVAKIALGDIGDNAEIEGEMLEDGFLKVWGIRRACEWVLGLHSVARQKQYCQFLVNQWIHQSNGFLLDKNGNPVDVDHFTELIKQAEDLTRQLFLKVTGNVPPMQSPVSGLEYGL